MVEVTAINIHSDCIIGVTQNLGRQLVDLHHSVRFRNPERHNLTIGIIMVNGRCDYAILRVSDVGYVAPARSKTITDINTHITSIGVKRILDCLITVVGIPRPLP